MEVTPEKSPVVFLIFNRPAATEKVFQAIRSHRPPTLLVVADGPRKERPSDENSCRAARAIIEKVDWPCDVRRHYSETNLGCKNNVGRGLDWAFDQVPEAIILEDDCLPDPSFFRFCDELLSRYRDNEKISLISGSNYQQGISRTEYSYYFSRHAHIWGWATWRRSWEKYNSAMTDWPVFKNSGWLQSFIGDAKAAFYWGKLFDDSYAPSDDSLNSWAIPWTFSCWKSNLISIVPDRNLVTNIGHGAEGTHTTSSSVSNTSSVREMIFPLKHPTEITAHKIADAYTEETFYYGKSFLERLFWNLRLPISVATVRSFRSKLDG